VVDSHGAIYGRLVEGDPKALAGKMCDKVNGSPAHETAPEAYTNLHAGW
jgi:hypothetical protein